MMAGTVDIIQAGFDFVGSAKTKEEKMAVYEALRDIFYPNESSKNRAIWRSWYE